MCVCVSSKDPSTQRSAKADWTSKQNMAHSHEDMAKTLVDVYSFDPASVDKVLSRVPDPTDLMACVNALLDSGEADHGGPVIPTQLCPHVHMGASEASSFISSETFASPACWCGDSGSTWLCLTCGQRFCGRYAHCHGLSHWRETPGHCMALGLSDLSVWCHECAAYVKHDRLELLHRHAAHCKFGDSSAPHIASLPPLHSCTAMLYDEQMARHAPPALSRAPKLYERATALEAPRRTRAVLGALTERGLAARCVVLSPPGCASSQDLERAHSSEYIASVAARSLSASQPPAKSATEDSGSSDDEAGPDVYFVEATADAASRAAACAVTLALTLQAGKAANGLALVRPPGHHARRSRAAGCCIFNSVAVAALAALAADEKARVMVLDWDVHHGDGLQSILWDEPRALYCSVHAIEPIEGGRFPTDGEAHHTGGANAQGTNLNVALPFDEAGHGDAALALALDEIFLPVAREFAPTLVLVAAGFDAAEGDPSGTRFRATPAGFARLTRSLGAHSLPSARGRVGLVLEGGYAPASLGECVAACVAALLGDDGPDAQPDHPMSPPSRGAHDAVEETRLAHENFWECLRGEAHTL